MAEIQRSLVLLKPDAVQRALVGELIGRLERRGLKMVGLKMMKAAPALAEEHYAAHVGKPFFEGLVGFITSSPLVAMVVEGEGAVASVRATMGATDPQSAAPGTVRGDLALAMSRNLIHGSDSPKAAATEIGLFFAEDELVSYERGTDDWVIEP